MKLNLLPTTVSKQKRAKTAWIWGGLILVGSAAASVALTVISSGQLADAKARNSEARPKADQAAAVAASADEIVAKSQTVLKNTSLARAMIAHNAVYPKLYDDLRGYIPSFYRVNSMSATPGGADVSTITLVGTLKTTQQYADLVLALMRFPGAITVSRQGLVDNSAYVPNLDATNQKGEKIKPGQGTVPEDINARLAYFESQAASSPNGYLNAGGFGGDPTQARGAMPEASLVTIQLVVNRKLQTPDPRATLASSNAAATPAPGATTPPAPGLGVPAAPGTGAPAITSAPTGGGKAAKGDE